MALKNRDYYENLFADYPDVLSSKLVAEMMGEISVGAVIKLLNQKHLKGILYLDQKWLVPKKALIDYLLSPHYQSYKLLLSAQI